MKKIHRSPNAPKPVGPYSQAVEANGFVFLSGQIAIDPATDEVLKTDVQTQTKQVMKNIEAVLKEADLTFAHVIKTTIFLTDMTDFAKVNEIYGSYFPSEPPARSCVAVAALPKGVQVEVEVLAKR